jgi:hypothetical protein
MRKVTLMTIAVGIIIIGSLTFVFIFWMGEKPESAGINRELLGKEWTTASYGNPPVRISTPEKLRATFLEGEGPQNMTQLVQDARSYTYNQGGALSILVNTVEYRPGINTSLQGAVKGAVYTLGQQPGVQELTHTVEDIQIQELESKKVSGSYRIQERRFAFVNVLMADSSHLWQITVIHPQDDENGAAIAERIIESVALET